MRYCEVEELKIPLILNPLDVVRKKKLVKTHPRNESGIIEVPYRI